MEREQEETTVPSYGERDTVLGIASSEWLLVGLQFLTVVLFIVAGFVPGSVWLIPDVVFSLFFPTVLLVLILLGALLLRHEGAHSRLLRISTTLCAALVAATVVIALIGFWAGSAESDF